MMPYGYGQPVFISFSESVSPFMLPYVCLPILASISSYGYKAARLRNPLLRFPVLAVLLALSYEACPSIHSDNS